MNTLSWILYAADVLASIPSVFKLTAAAFIAYGIARFVWSLIEIDNASSRSCYRGDGSSPNLPPIFNPIKQFLMGLVFILVVCFIPTKQTIYMIAASQMGEKVALSEDGKEIYELLRKRVKETLGADKS